MADYRYRAVTGEVVAEGRARAQITTFDSPYEYAPRVREEIAPSAFDGTDTIPVMYQHDHSAPPIGTATLTKTGTGVEADIQFFMDTERGRAAFNSYHTGAMKEWSVGFIAKPGDITTTRADGYVTERIERGDLMEVSTVLRGANKGTGTMHTRADGMGKVGSNNTSSAFGTDEGAAADGGQDPDTHNVDIKPGTSMIDAMAVMAGALKQMNSAHALLLKAHAGTEGGLTQPSTDDPDDDQGGPVLSDPAAASGAALRAYQFRDRMDYNADDRKKMAAEGQAMPDGSYPIANAEDLENAIHAVGRGSDNHLAIRKHIIARAKALGLTSKIPSNWGADGSEVKPHSEDSVHGGTPDRYRAELMTRLDQAWARAALRELS